MVTRIRHITFILAMLLLGSMVNEAWAVQVTYHILTIPFTTQNSDDGVTLTNRCENIRVEAVKVIVDETSPKVGLPAHFKSPLAQNFKYYASDKVTKLTKASPGNIPSSYFDGSNRAQIYQYMTTKFELYVINGTSNNAALPDNHSDLLTVGADIASDCDIYVTYEYNPSNGIAKLDGSQDYNIKLGDRFLCFNKDRANRPGAILASNVTEENLTSDDFTYIATPGFDYNKKHNFHFRFLFEGNDPYNIVLRTSYNGDETFFTDTDKALGNKNVKKWYKGSSLFIKGINKGNSNMYNLWIASDDDKQYTQTDNSGEVTFVRKPGYYRGGSGGTVEMNPIWNSLAMLNADNGEGYVFMGTKINSNGNNWQPNNGQYLYLTGNIDSGNNPKFQFKTPATAESTDPVIYEVRTYTYKVKTPLTNTVLTATFNESQYNSAASILDRVPDALKRKYATITKAYSDESLTNEITTFSDVETADNGRVIWLKYTTSLPFESLPSGGSYQDARWYTIRMNGQAENQNVAFYDTSNGNQFSTGRGSNTDGELHQGENSAEAQVAFIGDPYELKIISRATSEANAGNRYIGCATDASDNTALTSQTGSSDISTWEIASDAVSGSMVLRAFNTFATPKYIGWNHEGAGKPMTYSTTSSRIKVVELEKKNYVYHIINTADDVAVKATEAQDVGIALKYTNIPEIIRSPLIQPGLATITYYSDAGCTNEITNAPFNVTADSNKDIYVKYTITGSMPTNNYHVRLYTKYIYYNSGNISWSDEPVTSNDDPLKDYYIWHLDITDPYAMIINNTGITGDSKYVKVNGSLANKASLTWDVAGNASKFVVKTSGNGYEVMVATGDNVDAAEIYYNIGRNDADGVKIYSNDISNGGYAHNYYQLRFVLTTTEASSVDFHLIDKANNDLMVVRRRTNDLYFPDQYRSPLVSTYHYWTTADCNVALANVASAGESGGVKQVYVTYDTSDRINLQKGVLYLLRFEGGQTMALENGSDGFSAPVKAIYPYCNGDCNFFVYGQDQYDLQQEGAASTRTRWAWYVESTNNDPYHVKICSRQLETYNGADNRGYFCTYVENFSYPGEEAANHVITGLVWPGITGDLATEYMVLGSVGQYQLVTSLPLNDGTTNERRTVKSFEQYWKTFDTVRKKVFGDAAKTVSPNDPTTVPATPLYAVTSDAGLSSNRDYLEQVKGFHHYTQWAYAKRWNGYNISGKTSKGWEDIEHWYQTVDMGEGYFDFVRTSIDPALILLDQHGWEIMRRPLPSSPDDPTKEAKYDAIRPYDSPMVKEYIFWSSAKKRTGMHQYYLMDKRIGGDFTSTTLTELPPYGSENVLDAKGNLNDQYVTYIVKDEYADSYSPSSKVGAPFLIQQGDKFAYNDGTATIQTDDVPAGGMSQYVIDNVGTLYQSSPEPPALGTKVLWFVKPNTEIDYEMGYIDEDVEHDIKTNHDWGANPNTYEQDDYKNQLKAQLINDKTHGKFSFSNGFDPYNIQITSVADGTKHFVSNATGAILEEGELDGTYSTTASVSLGAEATGVTATWYDALRLNITNATFMAVLGSDGEIQLMPRFDHTMRLRDFNTLVTPVADISDPTKLTETSTKLYRPMVYNYSIIDNEGHESLRYRSAGELSPYIPEHLKSPLAKDYRYYKELTYDNATRTYTEIPAETDISSKEISGSLASAGLTATNIDGNQIYVRYTYDEEADTRNVLKGKWFTMQLDEKDAVYSSGIKQASGSKPDPVDAIHKDWQWKLLETQWSNPDPYAINLYNRSQSAGVAATANRFALLSHTSGDYALAMAGSGGFTYSFLNGSSMTDAVAATTAIEAGFTSTANTFSGTASQVKLLDDVEHTYNYQIYTLDGIFAIDGDQSQAEASQNEFVPTLPASILSPLLDLENFWYYDKADYTAEPIDTVGKKLSHLYGLYDDDIYVRYGSYDETASSFRVPNSKRIVDSHVDRADDSNDAALAISGNVLYNIIWYNDEMMRSYKSDIDGGSADDAIRSTTGQDLQAVEAYEWTLEGNDPYAIKIKSVDRNKYIHEATSTTCDLNATATTFMLIPREDYHYGVLAKTGDKSTMLSGHGNVLTTSDPTQFIPFALATHKVIYHLVIATTNADVTIPFRATKGGSLIDKTIKGSTQRDLTSVNAGEGTHYAGEKYQLGETINGQTYCYDAGHISLGDKLQVPNAFYRPNVNYHYFVEGVYTHDDCSRAIPYGTDGSHIAYLDDTYRGVEIDEMGREPELLGKTVLINIVYSFNTELETNNGGDFVRNVSDNKWYTIESKANDGTPWLAQYTNAWGLEVKEGRGTHYTNDYLWSPLGDPYGFKLYNRYIYKNSGALNAGEQYRVMTTADFSEGQVLTLSNPNNYAPSDPSYAEDPNSVYELLPAATDGYFRMHPVVNNSGDQYYLKTINDGASGVHVKLSTSSTEFTFGLSKDLFDPYFRYVGYIGALKEEVYEAPANADVVAAMTGSATPTATQLMAAQALVYDDDNIKPFTSGYYRLHSPAGIEGISPVRYASGYTHAIERDPNGDGNEADAIPMHFYEKEGVSTIFENLGGGYTTSNATRGEITIPAVEYDPASIFYLPGTADNTTMSTQGLYIKGAVGKTADDGTPAGTIEAEGVRSKAYMTASEATATPLWIMDIGGGVMLIHDRSIPHYRKYLSYHQNDGANIYDLKLTHNTHTDHAKWCLQPVNNLGLYLTTHSGGDEDTYGTSYNYASFYAPFDILLPPDEQKADEDYMRVYQAFILDNVNSPWDPSNDDLHPKSIGHYNTGTYAGNNKFVPAGTPVLLAMWDQTDVVKVTLPSNSPSTSLTTGISYTKAGEDPVSCNNLLTGTYLEQLLSPVDDTERIFTFGMQLEASSISMNASTGAVTAVLAHPSSAGIGFYLNANPNKELGSSRGSWTRNNRYVYGNKVYYKATGFPGSSPAPGLTRGVEYVPILFDDQQGEEPVPQRVTGDDRMYDLSGRCVATPQQVADGSWQQLVSPGIYIVNGRKVIKR